MRAGPLIDEPRVRRLLRSVSDDLHWLEVEGGADEARRADPMRLSAVKYTLITTIEGCVDVAHHLCAAAGWGPPADNGDAVRVLARHGVVLPDHADRLVRAVDLRDALLHEHDTVEDSIVLARLGDLSDLAEFLGRIAEWLPTT